MFILVSSSILLSYAVSGFLGKGEALPATPDMVRSGGGKDRSIQ